MEELLKNIEEGIKSMFSSESSGHDIYHLKRVLNLALHLQEREGGDRLVVAVAALLHDVHRIIQKEKGGYCSPKDSLPAVKRILEKTNVPKDKIPMILHCIEFHEEYAFSDSGKSVDDVETLILQDADNLDAIGAVGVGRTFAFSGARGRPMWVPELAPDRETYDESKDDPSTIHHFYSKLLKLKGNMNTETAKMMALKRHKFMELFLEEFLSEWHGEK